MTLEKRKPYLVFKFYIQENDSFRTGFQSRPIPIPYSIVKEYGYISALLKARDTFLTYGLKPIGDIAGGHERLWDNGDITHSHKRQNLTSKRVARMNRQLSGSQKKRREETSGLGWKRMYRRR